LPLVLFLPFSFPTSFAPVLSPLLLRPLARLCLYRRFALRIFFLSFSPSLTTFFCRRSSTICSSKREATSSSASRLHPLRVPSSVRSLFRCNTLNQCQSNASSAFSRSRFLVFSTFCPSSASSCFSCSLDADALSEMLCCALLTPPSRSHSRRSGLFDLRPSLSLLPCSSHRSNSPKSLYNKPLYSAIALSTLYAPHRTPCDGEAATFASSPQRPLT
jgi:hypothetical protein